MLPRNNADVTHCEKPVFYFHNKAVYRAEDRPTDIKTKNSFKISIKTQTKFMQSGTDLAGKSS